jgi:pimeloyl-ACP methyl ester carboxylesterase
MGHRPRPAVDGRTEEPVADQAGVAATVRTFDVGGLSLRGDEVLADDPRGTVLLLHGGGQTRHSWKGAAAVLRAAGWSSVSLDSRGHGESDWSPDGDYSMEVLATDLAQIAAEFDSPVLVGASMGGLTSLVATGEGKIVPRGLVLVDVAPRIEPEGTKRIGDFMRARPEGFANLEEVADAVGAYNPNRPRPRSLEGLKKNVRLGADGRWHWHWDPAFMTPPAGEPNRLVDRDQLEAAARGVTVPTLLVRGVQSDVLSAAGAQEFLTLIPGSRLVDVAGAGHMVAGDDNDVFARAVIDFLDGLAG